MRDVVFFTLFRTDNPYSSISLSMAKELAKNGRVFYVNHPYTLKDLWSGWRSGDHALRRRLPRLLAGRMQYETLPDLPQNFIAVQPPPTLPVNWMPAGRIHAFFQRFNNRIVLNTIRRVIAEHQVRDFVFINCYDPFYAGWLPAGMGAACSIYHCIDDITQNPYTNRHGTALENEAVGHADLTFVTSTNLKTLKTPFAKRIEYYFNAADLSVFGQVRTQIFEKPPELRTRHGQVIGFIGNLDDLRIDYPLLRQVALAFPDCTLLLVGPVNSPEVRTLGIDQLPNVVLAGSRKLADLPPYLQHMDCVLIPFLCNTLTKSIYPLKINEYLAAGKPVVSTAFSEDIRGFSDCICLAEHPDAFVEQIARALRENDPAAVERRLQRAAQNTWTARIAQLWRLVEGLPKKSATL